MLAAANGRIDTPRLRENASGILSAADSPGLRVAAIDYMAAIGERQVLLDRLDRDSAPEVKVAILNHLADPTTGGLRGDEPKMIMALAAGAKTAPSVREIAIHHLANLPPAPGQ